MEPGVSDPEGVGRYRHLSLWWDAISGPLPARPPLAGDLEADVCIVGAGFTGLWTARSLALADPSLRIVVVDKEIAGFGASGRNGGWCSALFSTSDSALARLYGLDAMRRMRRAMQSTVDEVGAAAHEEGIDCHFEKGGTIDAARTPAQRARAMADVEQARALGFGEEDLRWLDAGDASSLVGLDSMLGATFTPHCAAIQPALLARGLADAVERRGVTLHEHTEVIDIIAGGPGRSPLVRTTAGAIKADVVVRAVEAWTSTLPGQKRTLVPVYSLMVATEPLGDAFWADAGLRNRATFTDYRHMVIYGQRTADGRIAFGGAGRPITSAPTYDRPSMRHRPCTNSSGRRWSTSSPRSRSPSSRTRGVGRWAFHVTGIPRSASIPTSASPGPGAMWATASPPPISPVAPWPTSSRELTLISPTCPGSITGRARGSPNHCAGSASTAGCGR